MDTRFEIERPIRASPQEIFALLSDPQGHVRIDASGSLMAATGSPATKIGDEFIIHMDREAINDFPLGLYDVTISITAFDQDKEIAWTVLGAIDPPIGHLYGYRLEAREDGSTMVTSYYDWSHVNPTWKDSIPWPIIPEATLRATLGILARTVQKPS